MATPPAPSSSVSPSAPSPLAPPPLPPAASSSPSPASPSAPSPLAPPPLPPVRRLTRAVWIAAALLACITVFVVVFVAGPRRPAPAALPPPRPLEGSDPGFLHHPPGELPPKPPAPAQRTEDYLRELLARKGDGGSGSGVAGAGVGAAAGEEGAGGTADGPDARARGAATPSSLAGHGRSPSLQSDPRGDAFRRALTAPLSRGPSPPARDPESESMARWLAPVRGGFGAFEGADAPAGNPTAGTAAGTATGTAAGAGAGTTGLQGEDVRVGSRPTAGFGGPPAAPSPGSTLPVRFHPRPGAWTVPAGTVIPALLLTDVNSDLPGNLLAQVSRDVYDFRQEVALLPAGTRLLGRYDNQVALGQSRLVVAWTRVLLPDGSGFELPGLPGLPGVDAGGAAGLGGRVNRHVLRTFGDALLLSLLAAGAQLSQPQASGFGAAPSAGNVAAAALGQELSAAGLELVHRDVAIQPTLRLPAATPFLVFVNGDLDLAPLFAAGGPPAGSAAARRGAHARP